MKSRVVAVNLITMALVLTEAYHNYKISLYKINLRMAKCTLFVPANTYTKRKEKKKEKASCCCCRTFSSLLFFLTSSNEKAEFFSPSFKHPTFFASDDESRMKNKLSFLDKSKEEVWIINSYFKFRDFPRTAAVVSLCIDRSIDMRPFRATKLRRKSCHFAVFDLLFSPPQLTQRWKKVVPEGKNKEH